MKEKIYTIRGKKVILDSDLAELYQDKTRRINETVTRNKELFSSEFSWILSSGEISDLWSQNATANISKKRRVNPRVFTKEGVIKLSNIMKNENIKSVNTELLKLFDKNDITISSSVNIRNLIYEIRGKQVMLDYDLANLYQCKNGTKDINKAVQRNIERFPNDFYFQLTEEELLNLRFQFGTSSYKNNNYGGRRYLPYAFTEQGIAMLASVLKTAIAALTSVKIMRTFVEIKNYLFSNMLEQQYINRIVLEDNRRISDIEELLFKFKENANHIFFKGQTYDAYSLMKDIFNKSKGEIIIIDNYVDKKLFDILRQTDKKVILITNKYNNTDYEKYKNQYKNVELIINNDIHDRFIIIDRKIIYHCGASFKDLGKSCFSINEIDDEKYLNKIVKEVL